MKNSIRHILGIAVTAGAVTGAQAVTVLTFEGVGDLNPVGEFYNGGSGPANDFGISFGDASLAIVDSDAGGGGNFGGEPSPDTVLFFLSGSAIMDVPAGFDTGFSFFYSAVNNPGTVSVYDGLDGTGNLLAELVLPVTPSDGGDPTGTFSPFVPFGVTFDGVARSVDFSGTADQIGFDDVTIGSEIAGGGETTIPEPSGVMTLAALLGFGLISRRRQS